MPREYSDMELAQGAMLAAQDYLDICDLLKEFDRYKRNDRKNGCIYIEGAKMQIEIARRLSDGKIDTSRLEERIKEVENS